MTKQAIPSNSLESAEAFLKEIAASKRGAKETVRTDEIIPMIEKHFQSQARALESLQGGQATQNSQFRQAVEATATRVSETSSRQWKSLQGEIENGFRHFRVIQWCLAISVMLGAVLLLAGYFKYQSQEKRTMALSRELLMRRQSEQVSREAVKAITGDTKLSPEGLLLQLAETGVKIQVEAATVTVSGKTRSLRIFRPIKAND